MQNNTIVRIALCGILAVAHITLAMDVKTQVNRNKKTLLNGYYTNNLNSLSPTLPIYTYQGEKGVNNAVSKISYIDTETNTTQTVRFSGKNNSDERLEYNNEKYHVIINSEGTNLFAIKMNQTPTPSTSSGNSSTQRSGSISPRDDYDDSKFISQSNSPTQSPREKQTISQVLGGEKQIVYKPILDNIGLTYKQPTSPNDNTIKGIFTNIIENNNLKIHNCIKSEELGDNWSLITYQEQEGDKEEITLSIELPKKYNQERYIAVQENLTGSIKKYIIDLRPETDPTNQNAEQSDDSTDSLIGPEGTLQNPLEKQQFRGYFFSPSEENDNINCYEGLTIKLIHEFDAEKTNAKDNTVYGGNNYQYEIAYMDTTKNIYTAIINCPDLLNTTETYIATDDEIEPKLIIKLPTQTKTTQLTNLKELSSSYFSIEPYYDSMTKKYVQYNGKITETKEEGAIIAFTDSNGKKQELWVNGSTKNAICAVIKDGNGNIISIVKLLTQEAETTQPTNLEKTSSEQITETNNNNNNNQKEDDSSNLPISGKLTESQTYASYFARMPYNITSAECKQYDGKITKSNKQSSQVFFTDENNIDQEVWVNGNANGANFAIIKNSDKTVVCIVKLPTPKKEISKKIDFQRFNKNPNNRDPKYTVIGAAFLTICIALAYKYDKLPTVLTKLFDGCLAQIYKLTPSYFQH